MNIIYFGLLYAYLYHVEIIKVLVRYNDKWIQ